MNSLDITEECGIEKANRRRVLIMDDEAIIRKSAGKVLMKMGYEIEYATDGVEAIEIYTRARQENRAFDVVVVDLTIWGGIEGKDRGGMGGKETIKRLINIDPEVKAIISSGYSNDPIMSEYKEYGFRGVLFKPYTIEELSEIVHKVIDEK